MPAWASGPRVRTPTCSPARSTGPSKSPPEHDPAGSACQSAEIRPPRLRYSRRYPNGMRPVANPAQILKGYITAIPAADQKARRLSRRVLAPLLACALALVCGLTVAATLNARSAARHGIDVQAEALHQVAAAALNRTGHIGPAASVARASGGSVATRPADEPLPGG